MQQLVTCESCQAQAPPDAVHCPNCGQPMPRNLLQPGEMLSDDYEVVRLIGYGGMGEVYLAQHQLTQQQVAIKVLAMHLATEVDLRIRFLDEARILARLDHPNIVMLHNFKQDKGRMLILMQYVDGESLDRIIEREGPLSSELAAVLFAPLCDALGHAHDTGIIHRDLKPSNILVDRSGKARLTDFGIAKLTGGGADLTRTGTRVGTSWFMSPEQGLNKPAEPRSDIYAMGVTLYNTLTGRLPFSGDSEYEVIKGHVELPPPAIFEGETDALSIEVERIVRRAMSKGVEERYQSGYEMRDALLQALSTAGQRVRVSTTSEGGVFALHAVQNGPTAVANASEPSDTVVEVPSPEPVRKTQVTPAFGLTGGAAEVPPSKLHTPPMPTGVRDTQDLAAVQPRRLATPPMPTALTDTESGPPPDESQPKQPAALAGATGSQVQTQPRLQAVDDEPADPDGEESQ